MESFHKIYHYDIPYFMSYNPLTTENNRFEFTTYGGLVEGLTQEEFFSGVSRPRNPEIMRIFKDLEYVERLGSGIPYIVNKYGRDIFKLISSIIRYAYLYETSIENTNDQKNHPKTTKKTDENYLKINQEQVINHQKTTKTISVILWAIQTNPHINRDDLSKLSGLSINQVRGCLEKLKKDGIILRVGSKRNGYWEIIK